MLIRTILPRMQGKKKTEEEMRWQREEKGTGNMGSRRGRKKQKKQRRQLRAEMTGQQERVQAPCQVAGAGKRRFCGPEQQRWVSWDLFF